MALDPSDFLEEPYSFGKCEDETYSTSATCECFEKSSVAVNGHVKKVGDLVTVRLPSIISECKDEEVDNGKIVVQPFLGDDYLGENPRIRYFGGYAKVIGLASGQPMVAPCLIKMDIDGTITITPSLQIKTKKGDEMKTSEIKCFYTPEKQDTSIGSLAIDFSYIIDDNHTFDEPTIK